MKTLLTTLAIATTMVSAVAQSLPERADILKAAESVNGYFMKKYADYTEESFVRGVKRPSNIWTRGVYYEGLMALYEISPSEKYYKYAYDWADFHKWGYRGDCTTRNADNYCAGQTYIDLYNLEPESFKLRKVKANLDMLVNTPQVGDWTWIDAIQMGMPVFAKYGNLTDDRKYFDKMWDMYECSRNTIGGGLYNKAEGLWWRDADFVPPYKEPNGANCYWSRGNGWVYAALVRVMSLIPNNETHFKTYLEDFKAMSEALVKCQRQDGFWNVSLLCEENFGGKETTGTSLFVYGMAWGMNNGYLEKEKYLPVVIKAWNAMVTEAIHKDTGFLGYVQGTGKEPKDGQPVTYTSVPDFEDYGVGCFLLAASEMYKLTDTAVTPKHHKTEDGHGKHGKHDNKNNNHKNVRFF